MGTRQAVGWLLTLEPVGDGIAYSLFRNDGEVRLIEAQVRDDVGALASLVAGLMPDPMGGGVWAGALADPELERSAAIRLGTTLLPAPLREALTGSPEQRQTVSVAGRGWLAQVPWDAAALTADGAVRLVERARVVGALSPAILARRALAAADRDLSDPGLVVIDPGPVAGTEPPLFPGLLPDELLGADGIDGADVLPDEDLGVSSDELSHLLLAGPARLLYFGHVLAAPPDTPAAAALLLRDGPRADRLTARRWIAEPHRWPAPPRVALVGCASNDTAHHEQSGLVVAAINAGAAVVTSTRWLLPADAVTHSMRATTQLALTVYRAHRAANAVDAIRSWQLEQLQRWRSTGDPEWSPVLWSSLVTYAPPLQPTPD